MNLLLTGLVLFIVFVVASYFYTNSTYIRKPIQKMYKAGFQEKQITLKNGTQLNYGEGPKNGKTPLVLIHGQGMTWEDYAKVLPTLKNHYHVFAIDCHGHGKSERNPEKYSAKLMAQDFVEFIKEEIGEKTVISGHSSGGMIAAYIAAYSPEIVLGTVIEDSPFFSTELDRRENTYVWIDSFQLYEDFKNQDTEIDYFNYYLKHSYWQKIFGKFIWNKLSKDAIKYRQKHPNKPVHLKYLPPQINRLFESATYPYDRRFGETFYTNTWFDGYYQAEVLSNIKTPTLFIKATTRYDGNLLVAALSDEDADIVVALLENGERVDVQSGHDVHYDRPKAFSEIMVNFFKQV